MRAGCPDDGLGLVRAGRDQSAVGAIVGAALIVFLVLLFTDIVGATDVFDFVN